MALALALEHRGLAQQAHQARELARLHVLYDQAEASTSDAKQPLPSRERVAFARKLWRAWLALALALGPDQDTDTTSSSSHDNTTTNTTSSPFEAVRWAQTTSLVRDDKPNERPPVVMWHGSLRLHASALWGCSLWRSLDQASRDDPRRLLISKSFPQRCEIREMSVTTLAKLAKHPDFARDFETWIECSLLGMYPHSQQELSPQRLAEYFDLTRLSKRRRVFFALMIRRYDVLACMIARDYFIHLVKQQPALLKAIVHTFPWARYVDIWTRAGADLRRTVNRHGWAVLFRGDPTGGVDEDPLVAALAALDVTVPPRKPPRKRAKEAAAP